MQIVAFFRSKWVGAGLGVLVVLAALAWWQRDSLLAWYYVQGLIRADDSDREQWIERIIQADSASTPELVHCLERQDAQVCGNGQIALARLWEQWPAEDARRTELPALLADAFPRLSLAGQRSALDLQVHWLEANPTADLVTSDVRLLPAARRSLDKQVRKSAMTLANRLLMSDRRPEIVAVCRESIRQGFQDAEAENRTLAVHFAARGEAQLLPQLVPLLDDPAPAVRQAALAALGPAGDAVTTDDLLHSLHDSDEDVRRLCEATLRGRGLRNEDVALGRLITDPRASVRLQVFDTLRRANDLEPGVWLRRMSSDPVPAVRAAAVRAAGESRVDLTDRLTQMAQNDPSPTVRQLATFYVGRQKNIQLVPSEP
jgi:HEAT repeat protein